MIKKLVFIGLVLVLTIVLFPVAVLGSSDNEVYDAQKSAQYWVDYIAAVYEELAQWKGAVATSPQPYENLEGEVNAYMFTVVSDKETAGHILVGSSAYDYAMFEAGEAAPSTVPSTEEACAAIESLGISTKRVDSIQPTKLLYLGLDNQYALYDVNGNQVAVNLVFKNAKSLIDLQPKLPSPIEYQATIQSLNKKSTRELSGASSNILPMYYFYDSGSGRIWCGPCSGVSILRYYRDYQGYSSLPNDNSIYDLCYVGMNCATYGGATMPWLYGNGITWTTQYYGYYNFNAYLDSSVSFSDYESVVEDIDSGWPTALCIVSQWHWRAIRGYIYDTSVDCYFVACTNSQTQQNTELVNWLTMGWWNCTVAIKDDG